MALSRKAWAVLAVVGLGVIGFANRPKDTPRAPAASASASPPPVERRCVIHIPGSPNLSVPAFPTEDGLAEFVKASVSGDEQAMQVALRANAGVLVESGSKCLWLDRGLMRTKARILAGAHEGKAVWVPTEFSAQ